MTTELEVTEGVQFDKGYISPYFVTDPRRMEAVLEDALVLLVSGKICALADLLPLLEKVLQTGKPLLIVAEDVEGEALSTLVVNAIRKTFKVVAVKAPVFGDRRKAFMAGPRDRHRRPGRRAGGRPQARPGRPRGARHRPPGHRHQGRHHDRRRRRHGRGARRPRRARSAREIEDTDSDWDREKLQERLAKLAGGVAVIKVGAATEVELKERKHRIEDAISATRAAVEEGIVAGGGSALVHAASALDGPRPDRRRADRRPHRPQGAGRAAALDRRERRPRGLRRGQQGRDLPAGHGFNAATGEYGDLVEAGIIDPVKVTQAALANAASIAGLVLTTETPVVEKPEEEDDHARRRARRTATRTAGTATATERRRRPDAPSTPRGSTVLGPLQRGRSSHDERAGSRRVLDGPSGVCRGCHTPAATAAGSAAISRARSSSLMPPQTPYGSRTDSACLRQASITGHRAHTALAAAWRRARAGPRSPSGWKNRDVLSPRHAPWSCQSQTSATGSESANVGHFSSRARREPEGDCPAARSPVPSPSTGQTHRDRSFLLELRVPLLTPGGEGRCCPGSIKLEPGRSRTGRGRNPDPRRDRCRGGVLPLGSPARAAPAGDPGPQRKPAAPGRGSEERRVIEDRMRGPGNGATRWVYDERRRVRDDVASRLVALPFVGRVEVVGTPPRSCPGWPPGCPTCCSSARSGRSTPA